MFVNCDSCTLLLAVTLVRKLLSLESERNKKASNEGVL